ncbi:MAG TPA: hypothetical protein VIJ57_00430 [Hanamia sp.]
MATFSVNLKEIKDGFMQMFEDGGHKDIRKIKPAQISGEFNQLQSTRNIKWFHADVRR